MNVSWHSPISDGMIDVVIHLNINFNYYYCKGNRTIASPGWVYTRNNANSSPTQYQQQHTHFHNQSLSSLQNTSWNSYNNSSLTNRSAQNVSINSNTSIAFTSPYKNYSKNDVITDERELQQYLKYTLRPS